LIGGTCFLCYLAYKYASPAMCTMAPKFIYDNWPLIYGYLNNVELTKYFIISL